MSKVEISHVENGYIVQITKFDIVDQRPKTTITIHSDLPAVLKFLEDERI